MTLIAILRASLDSLGRHRLRTVLTTLGIIIGVAPLIIVVSLGQSAYTAIAAEFERAGTRIMAVVVANPPSVGPIERGTLRQTGKVVALTVEDADAIRRDCPSVEMLSEEVYSYGRATHGVRDWATEIQGVGARSLEILPRSLEAGRFFTQREARTQARVCVLGPTVADALFPRSSPIGKTIALRNVPLQVIGLLAPRGRNLFGKDDDDVIVAPFSTVQWQMTTRRRLHQFLINARTDDTIETAREEVLRTLRARYGLRSAADADRFKVFTLGDIKQMMIKVIGIVTAVFGGIVALSLLVGGIGIMNIMLVAVQERTREIGIRMAVGARRRHILAQFLLEAVTLTVGGGLCGIVTGIALIHVTTALGSAYLGFTLPTLISMEAIGISVVFSAMVGLFFGLYPAWKASELDPIECLRCE